MDAIRLMHPEHGYTHVYSENELKRHEAQGWKIAVIATQSRAQADQQQPIPRRRNRK